MDFESMDLKDPKILEVIRAAGVVDDLGELQGLKPGSGEQNDAIHDMILKIATAINKEFENRGGPGETINHVTYKPPNSRMTFEIGLDDTTVRQGRQLVDLNELSEALSVKPVPAGKVEVGYPTIIPTSPGPGR